MCTLLCGTPLPVRLNLKPKDARCSFASLHKLHFHACSPFMQGMQEWSSCRPDLIFVRCR